ncbi:MAG: hypothetical protein DWQ02_27820 [Bacteroidetes bacterium]|nr:MAG: hypothetical protein DWQ02_27820 [Bacteroidota bacterium]
MTNVNPGLFTGGMGMESKYATIMMFPPELRPKTVLARPGQDFEEIKTAMKGEGLDFPLIAKPDIGYRGMLVKKVKNELELRAYLEKYPLDFLLQEFIDLPKEGGVLYYRYPDEERGKITSVTLKEFLTVKGDGESTVLELVKKSDRALLQLERLKENYAEVLQQVPPSGTEVPLGSIGNHSKGTAFINGNHLIDREMEDAFQKIVDQLEGIDYGRFDLKCTSYEDMKRGKNIKVIEINGIGAEPTHIYDPTKMSYFEAVGTITKHWKIILNMSRKNRQIGIPRLKTSDLFRYLLKHRRYVKKINRINNL